MRIVFISIVMVFLNLLPVANALDANEVAKKRLTPQNLYLSPAEAHKMVTSNNNVLFVDVRSRVEIQYFGIADGVDANIPLYYVDQWHWNKLNERFSRTNNKDFVKSLERRLAEKKLTKADPIIFICKSGARSKRAAKAIYKEGFKNVYIIPTGFDGGKAKSGPKKGQRVIEGWKFDGLPWSYDLDPKKFFFPEEYNKVMR